MRKFLLGLTAKDRPRVLYIPTAGGDNPTGVLTFFEAFSRHECSCTWLPLFLRQHEDIAPVVRAADLIYVGGGNTANMLAIWRLHGVDALLREAWQAGKVLAGASAGSLCWFECGITDSFGLQLTTLHDGLGFLKGSHCPHYDSEERRRPVYTAAVAAGFPGGYAVEDGVGLHFVDGELGEVVSARPSSRAYRVEARDGQAVETPLSVRYLG